METSNSTSSEDVMIGELIRAIRTIKNISGQALADQLGIKNSYLSMIENNKKGISKDKIEEIAKILEVDSNILIRFQQGKKRSKFENLMLKTLKDISELE